MKMSNGTPEMRLKAYTICREYLDGAWKSIQHEQMIFKQIMGGMSNLLYFCALPEEINQTKLDPEYELFQPSNPEYDLEHGVVKDRSNSKPTVPRKILLRLYGQIHSEGFTDSLLTESVIFTMLSERNLGPKLYGVFPGGRLEEYIPARCLKTAELSNRSLSLEIAEKLALVHCMNVPITKEPTWLWKTIDKWIQNIEENNLITQITDDPTMRKKLEKYSLRSEAIWLRSYLHGIGSLSVFCHNDLQEGNILLKDSYQSEESRLVLIDFEYCSYNYRAFDLANHFCEWTYDCTVKDPPYFAFRGEQYPSKQEQLAFVEKYLSTLKSEGKVIDPTEETDKLLNEIDHFQLASHFFWGLWAIVNAHHSKITFGYTDYAFSRLDNYFAHKELLKHSCHQGKNANQCLPAATSVLNSTQPQRCCNR